MDQENRGFGGGAPQLYDVDVNCSKCGKHIDKAPIPVVDPNRPFFCRDCYRPKGRGFNRGGGDNRGGFRRDY